MNAAKALATIALFQLASALPAAAQSDFVWFYDSYFDPDPFQSRMVLTYGLPQTDAIQFTASCQIGAGGTYALVQLGADIGRSRDGTDVNLLLQGRNFGQSVLATTFGQNAEVGITGVEFTLELDDPLWQVLSRLTELRYKVDGRRSMVLPLRGSSRVIGQFVRDCSDPPEVARKPSKPVKPITRPSNPSRVPTDTPLGCDLVGRLKSLPNGAPVNVEIINATDATRGIFWLDFDGQPVQYATLEPGGSYVQQTGEGHPWMVTDGPGNCLEVYVPSRRDSSFVITVPNQNFGRE